MFARELHDLAPVPGLQGGAAACPEQGAEKLSVQFIVVDDQDRLEGRKPAGLLGVMARLAGLWRGSIGIPLRSAS